MTAPESIETASAPKGRLSIRTIAMPADTNPNGQIFGGWLMSQMDLAGGTHAFQRTRGRVVTVAVDAMEFHRPVHVGDELSCYTEVIRVEAWVRRRSLELMQQKVTSATFVYVAIEEGGAKRPVPPEET